MALAVTSRSHQVSWWQTKTVQDLFAGAAMAAARCAARCALPVWNGKGGLISEDIFTSSCVNPYPQLFKLKWKSWGLWLGTFSWGLIKGFFIAISEVNPPLKPGSSGKMYELADYEQKESNPPTLKTSFILKRWGRAILCYLQTTIAYIHTMEVSIHVCST